jgi:uncharacterized protein (TIGR03905 family)
MKYVYTPHGICPAKIEFEIEGDIIKNISFYGGCNGNLQALSKLIEGMPVSTVKEKLSGIRCGHKTTSCADQLVKGIDEALEKSKS